MNQFVVPFMYMGVRVLLDSLSIAPFAYFSRPPSNFTHAFGFVVVYYIAGVVRLAHGERAAALGARDRWDRLGRNPGAVDVQRAQGGATGPQRRQVRPHWLFGILDVL